MTKTAEKARLSMALDLDQVLEELGGSVSRQLIRLEIARGHLKAHRFGDRRILVLRSDLEEYLSRRIIAAPASARRSGRIQGEAR